MSRETIAAIEVDTPVEFARRMPKTKAVGYAIAQVGVVAVFLGVWQLASDMAWIDPFFVSSPVLVAKKLAAWMADGSLSRNLEVTLREALLGWLIGSVAGTLLGFVLGRVEVLQRVFIPLLHLANALPRIALAPLFIFWFGIDEISKVILVVTIIIFIMIFNTYSGVLTVPNEHLLTARLFGKSERRIMVQVIFPWCVPWIFVGLRLGLAWSLSGAVVGEFIAARAGIGYAINNAASSMDNAGVLAGCAVLLAVALVFFIGISAAERHLLRWRPETVG
jgi:NitT/TauT family transport system permease protein